MSLSAGYVVRRLVVAIALLFALASITFWVDHSINYDAGQYLLRSIPHPTDAQRAHADHLLGVDQPALAQYRDFLIGLVHGDLGVSWESARLDRDRGFVADPVGPLVLRAAGVTGSLLLGGGLLLLVAAIRGGAYLAARAGSWADRTVLLVALAALSTHPLVLGNLLQLVFGEELGWVPSSGYCPFFSSTDAPDPLELSAHACGGPVDWATHLVLPWISFAALMLALHLRQMRAASLTVLSEPYIVAARARGVSERALLRDHVVPNALPPVVTTLATDMGAVLGVALYVEVVFGLPGLGRLFLVAVEGSVGYDRPVVVGVVIVVGAAVILTNLVAELIIARLDPRVRLGDRGEVLGTGG